MKKIMKESYELTNSPHKEIIGEHFDHTFDFEFLDIVAAILDRVDDFTDDDSVYQALDDELIYYDDQWKVMMHYQNPADANFNEAYESLYDDLLQIAREIAEQEGDEGEVEDFDEGYGHEDEGYGKDFKCLSVGATEDDDVDIDPSLVDDDFS